MTVYYDPQQPVWKIALGASTYKDTSFAVVVRSLEFWGFFGLHCTLVFLTKSEWIPTDYWGSLTFEAAASVQFFMTFLLTFYNKHCFLRYMKLYDGCTEIIDGALLFVFELSVIFQAEELKAHRMLSAKYVLAVVYIFFLGLTGGELHRQEWLDMERKGLVSKTEVEALCGFPGGKPGLVLANWALQVVDNGLEKDVFFERDEANGGARQQRTEHLHNRLDAQLHQLIERCEEVGDIVGLPIPYPYFHLMNMCLVINFFMGAFVFALLKNYITIFLYTVMLLIFFGFKVVATQLSDPFGQDEVDFPVCHFLNYVFHHSMCLLEAFTHQDLEALWQNVHSMKEFNSDQLKLAVDQNELYMEQGSTPTTFQWPHHTPVDQFDPHTSVLAHMHALLKPRLVNRQDGHGVPQSNLEDAWRDRAEAARLETLSLEEERQSLERQLQESRAEIDQLEHTAKELGIDVPEEIIPPWFSHDSAHPEPDEPADLALQEQDIDPMGNSPDAHSPPPPGVHSRSRPENGATRGQDMDSFEDAREIIRRTVKSLGPERHGVDNDDDGPEHPPAALSATVGMRTGTAALGVADVAIDVNPGARAPSRRSGDGFGPSPNHSTMTFGPSPGASRDVARHQAGNRFLQPPPSLSAVNRPPTQSFAEARELIRQARAEAGVGATWRSPNSSPARSPR